MQLCFTPFKSQPKKEDSDDGQYEFLKLKKTSKMTLNMCQIFSQLNSERWDINQRLFSCEEYKCFLGIVIESEACCLSIVRDQNQNIMRLPAMINFTNLR
jgi:hypothetical protein